MTRPEVTTISIEEYKRGEKNRIHESELAIDGLYIAMFMLEVTKAPAIKFPARITELEPAGDFKRVSFDFLDADLQPSLTGHCRFKDYYILSNVSNGREPTGYFRHYANSRTDQDLQTMMRQPQNIPAVAVPAPTNV